MKITIENTKEFTSVNGSRARIWNGVTEKGVECKVLVVGLAVKNENDATEFEAELMETEIPKGLKLGGSYDKK